MDRTSTKSQRSEETRGEMEIKNFRLLVVSLDVSSGQRTWTVDLDSEQTLWWSVQWTGISNFLQLNDRRSLSWRVCSIE